jgi:hypothetical protein
VRQALVAILSRTLAEFVIARDWLNEDRARRVAKEACEKATVALAATTARDEVGPLIRHLRESGQLTAGLILRALLSGNMTMFEEALAELSGMTRIRVSALIQDRGGAGLRALYFTAGLPAAAYPAFREAVATMNEDGFLGDPSGTARLKRRMIERVLTRCSGLASEDIEPLMMLLRRFATEAAREEARMFCDDLVDTMVTHASDWQDDSLHNNDADHAGADDDAAAYAGYPHVAYTDAVQDNGGYAYAGQEHVDGGADYAATDQQAWNDVSPDVGLTAEGGANDSDAIYQDARRYHDAWSNTDYSRAPNYAGYRYPSPDDKDERYAA